jgi:predicted DNA-binding transcriptional regulator AlpA
MKEEIIKELNFEIKKNKLTVKGMAKYCNVSKPTMYKLVNEGKGTLQLLEKALEFIKKAK